MTNAEIAHFCRQSLNGHLQSLNILITGSFSDLPLLDYVEHRSDVDILSWDTDIHISSEDSPIPRQFTGQFYRLETCNSPDGFAKVISYENNGNSTYYGKRSHVADPNHGPAYTIDRLDDHYKLTTDLVTGLRCSFWPSKATEWKERKRHNGWPSNEIVRKIINDGCHLVMKPHPSHPDDENEWRFSFSLAESTLARTWNDAQRYIYRTLRHIKSNIVKEAGGSEQTILKTYHLKTLLFWACEERTPEFWEEGYIETAVKELLCQMIGWLIEKRCPNYFIPSCNLFDYQCIDIKREVELLVSYAEDLRLDPLQLLRYKDSVHFRFPRKLILSVQIVINCMNFVDPLQPEKAMSSLNRLARHPLLIEEIQWIYKAMSTQRDVSLGREDAVVQEVKRCFSLAKASNIMEREYCPITIRQSDNVYGLITNSGFTKFHSADNHDECLESESVPEFFRDFLRFVDEFDDQFIRPSYFLRAAYEANFCYTELHDFQSAKRICNDAIDLDHKLRNNGKPQLSAEWGEFYIDRFSVVITDTWIRIFDAAIVATTGFLVLCDAVKTTIKKLQTPSATIINQRELGCLSRSKEKLLIRLNPVHFLRYIKLRSLMLPYEQQRTFRIHSNDFLTSCLKWSGIIKDRRKNHDMF